MDRRTFLKSSGAAAAAATTAASATAQASELSAPGKLAGLQQHRMHVQWPLDTPGLGTTAAQFIAHLGKATDGRLQISVAEMDAGAPARNIERVDFWTIGFADDDFGLAPAFASMVGSLTWHELDTWLRSAGGQVLWDEHAADMGVKPLLIGHTTKGGGLWMRERIPVTHILRGDGIAVRGIIARILREIGTQTHTLSSSETLAALQSGEIAGAAGTSAYADMALGLPKFAKYHYEMPGFDTGLPIVLAIPLMVWQHLSSSDQSLVEAIAAHTMSDCVAEHAAHDGLVRDAMRNRLTEFDAKLPMPLRTRVRTAPKNAAIRLAAEDADLQRVHDSVQGFLSATRDRNALIS